MTNEAAAGEFGYRSTRSQVDVDCAARRDRVIRIDLYPEHNLAGQPRTRHAPGGWAHPSPDAYLADVIDAVCSPPSPAVRLAAAAPDTARPAPSPVVLRVADAGPQRRTPAVLAPSTPAPHPVAGRPAPLLAIALNPTPIASRGRVIAQIAAVDTAAGAAGALAGLKGSLPSGVSTEVAPATVNGRKVYRAVVLGFASAGDAHAFCTRQHRSGETCWVR